MSDRLLDIEEELNNSCPFPALFVPDNIYPESCEVHWAHRPCAYRPLVVCTIWHEANVREMNKCFGDLEHKIIEAEALEILHELRDKVIEQATGTLPAICCPSLRVESYRDSPDLPEPIFQFFGRSSS